MKSKYNTFSLPGRYATRTALLSLLLGAASSHAQTATTWNGGGTDANWSTSGNWTAGAPSANGTWALTFSGTTRATNTHDIAGAVTLASLNFSNTTSAQAFTLNRTGTTPSLTFSSGATLSTAVVASGSIVNNVSIPVTLSGSLSVNLGTNHRVQFNNGISGNGGTLGKTGSGELAIFGGISNLGFEVLGGALTIATGTLSNITDPIVMNGGSLNIVTGNHPFGVSLLQNATVRGYSGQSPNFTGAIFNTPSAAAANVTLTLGGGNGGVIQGIIQNNTTNNLAVTCNTANAAWKLAGANTYSGATNVSSGSLTFLNTAALSPSTVVNISAGASLGLGVGGPGFYSSADVDSLFTNSLPAITLNAASGVAIDTTAGDFTYATSQSAARALTKLGANTLTLTGANSYTGGTTISAGTVQFATTGAMPASGTVAVQTGGGLAVNVGGTNEFTTGASGAGTIGGLLAGTGGQGAPVSYTGNVTLGIDTTNATGEQTYAQLVGTVGTTLGIRKSGPGALVLSGANSYTGGTVISAGTLRMGSATALGGGAARTVSVAADAVLDLNGQTMTTANTYALTLNGSGISGGGAMTNNSSTAATFFGTVTLGSDSTIGRPFSAGAVTLGSGSSANGISGNHALSVVGTGQLTVFGNIQTASVTKTGTGTLRLESNNTFAGGFMHYNGSAVAKNAGAFGGGGSGTIYLGATSGSLFATLSLGLSTTFSNPIVVQAGSTGILEINNFANFTVDQAGDITLGRDVNIRNTNTSGIQNLTVSGDISGTGGLVVQANNAANPITLTGANTYGGDTQVTGGILVVSGNALPDGGNLVIDGGRVESLGTEVVDTLFFGTIQQASGTWGATGSGASNIDDVRFAGTSGVIQVAAGPSGYGNWATTNAGGQAANFDFDNDGTKNGVEYFLNSPAGFTALPVPDATGKITWTNGGNLPASEYKLSEGGQFEVQTSINLIQWTPVPAGSLSTNTNSQLSYTLPAGQPRIFARLVVLPD